MSRSRFPRRRASSSDMPGLPPRPPGSDNRMPRKQFPRGLILWVMALLLLAAVIGYDRTEVKHATESIDQGHEFETQGLFVEAVEEYTKAFDNKRLSRGKKAEVAIS